MIKPYSRLLLAAVLAAVLLMPATLLAGGLGSHLAVRCFDTDPIFPRLKDCSRLTLIPTA